MRLIATAGIDAMEMRRTFNMGIGMIIVVAPEVADRAVSLLAPQKARVVGRIVPRGTGPASRLA